MSLLIQEPSVYVCVVRVCGCGFRFAAEQIQHVIGRRLSESEMVKNHVLLKEVLRCEIWW